METRVIYIQWEKHEFNHESISKLNEKRHRGLYQIYADHPIYGRDTLVYIGQAWSHTFASRLGGNHYFDFVESILYPTCIRIGMIREIEDGKFEHWTDLIDEAEKLLIISHLPAFNACRLKNLYPENSPSLLIYNLDDIGDLLPEISTHRVSYRYWTNENVLELK